MELVNDDIVISGIGGYFPKAKNVEEFQQLLLQNENLITTRWTEGRKDGVCNAIGAIDAGNFDHGHFRILRQQCPYLDPMYCLAYERAYEALLDAGVNPIELKGKNIGCFLGSAIGESDNILSEVSSNGYGITGHSRAMLPSRISYWLDIKGPSFNVFCNWLSGLEVLRIAYDSIKNGLCEAAIVGATNLTVHSAIQWAFNEMGILSPDGTTRCFDADGNGIVRSDGVVMFYLQRANDAKRTYASIVKIFSEFDGSQDGPLLDLDVDHFSTFLENFYKDLPVKPNDVDFVEACGCGIKNIDKTEIEGLERVYCKDRKDPLLIGSVKSNAGHSEATSALFGLVKVLIAMETETIPATINYKNPNPHILALKNGSIEVVAENRKWSGEYAAVNAFGLDSYYGHILLKSNPKKKIHRSDGIPRLILAASRTEAGIQQMIETILTKPNIDVEYINLIQEFYSKPTPMHTCRGYILQGNNETKNKTQIHQGNKAPVWFVYSGMGSQWNGMIGDLMKISIVANTINKCHDILATKGVNLKEILTSTDPKVFDNILNCFVGIASIQIALTDVLKALEIVPDGIIGHSTGELGCAYADGCVTVEQAILAAYYRGRASLEATLPKGMMAAVGLGNSKVSKMLPPTIEVACHNGPDSCTISGPREDMEVFVKKLQNEGIFARLVNVANIAYHSKYIKPVAPILLKYLKQILPAPIERSPKWISTSHEESNWNTDLAKYSSAEYHTNNLLSSVLFEEGLRHIPKDAILIEIAPHGLLQAILKRSCKTGCVSVPLTQRGIAKNLEFLLNALGNLYLCGLNMNLPNLYPKISYPVGKGTDSLASLAHWDHTYWENAYGENVSYAAEVNLQGTLNTTEFRDCIDHQLNNEIVIPTTTFLKIVFDIMFKVQPRHEQVIFEEITLAEPVIISEFSSIPIHAMVQKASGYFEILSGTQLIVSGKITFPSSTERCLLEPIKIDNDRDIILSEYDIYSEFQHRGHQYSGSYRPLKRLTVNTSGSVGIAEYNGHWSSILEAMIQQHLFHDEENTQQMAVPKFINKIVIDLKALPTETSNLSLSHDYKSNVLTTKGVNLIGLQERSILKEKKDLTIESIEFVPLENVSVTNIETGMITVLQMVLDNFCDQGVAKMTINEVKSIHSSLSSNIQNIFKFFPNIDFNISTLHNSNLITFKSSVPHLVIYNEKITPDLADLIVFSHGFLLTRSCPTIESNRNLVEVFNFIVNGISYSLLRKSNNSQPIIVNVQTKELSVNDLFKESVAWIAKLEEAIVLAKKQQTVVLLISHIMPVEGIHIFTKKIANLAKMELVRLLFVVNTDIKLNDLLIHKIFQRNLALTVVKNNACGTISSIPIELKKFNSLCEISTNGVDIKYVGLNNDPAFISHYDSDSVINLDYSGVDRSGQRIFGMAKFDKNTSKLSLDPILSWPIPDIWTFEDAATVSLAYISAYYCLVIKGKLEIGATVLIHSGCTSIGLAAISIATTYKCSIFTTVETEEQKYYLKQNFNFFKDYNIFNSSNQNFEPLLAELTFGSKANVVLNNLSRFIQSSCDCVAEHGKLILIGNFDDVVNPTIGMKLFEKSGALSIVELGNIYKFSNEVKEEIKVLVQEGINNFTVRGMDRKILEEFDLKQSLSAFQNDKIGNSYLIAMDKEKPLNKLLSTKAVKFVCNQNASYLVYGGTSDEWCAIVEWLVFRGARKIAIAVKSKPCELYINRKLALFQSNYNVDVAFAPLEADTIHGATKLISNVNILGQIDVVFILPQSSNHSEFIKNVLINLAPKASLVNLNTLDISEHGYFNLQWESDLSLSDGIYNLDNILTYKIANSFIRTTVVSAQQNTISIMKKLNLLVPSVDEITQWVVEAPQKPKLIQITTVGPREIRELPPFFVIPGLTGYGELESLCFNLLYPVYSAVLPASPMSINDIARHLVKQMKEIYSGRVFNIIAVSWGGALMVEIASILDHEGASLHLYFIDSAPDTIKSAINYLGETESEFEINLLSKIFKIKSYEQRNALLDKSSWSDRIESAINSNNIKTENVRELQEGLNILKERLVDVKNHNVPEKLIAGKIHLIRPNDGSEFDTCGLINYCQQLPKITLVSGNHLSIINKRETVSYINQNHYVI